MKMSLLIFMSLGSLAMIGAIIAEIINRRTPKNLVARSVALGLVATSLIMFIIVVIAALHPIRGDTSDNKSSPSPSLKHTYECTENGCLKKNGTGYFRSEDICKNKCPTYECTENGCVLKKDGTGYFRSEDICKNKCPTYECTENGCVLKKNGTGYFRSEDICKNKCPTYECTENGCVLKKDGTGYFRSEDICKNKCPTYDYSEKDKKCVLKKDGTGKYKKLDNCPTHCCPNVGYAKSDCNKSTDCDKKKCKMQKQPCRSIFPETCPKKSDEDKTDCGVFQGWEQKKCLTDHACCYENMKDRKLESGDNVPWCYLKDVGDCPTTVPSSVAPIKCTTSAWDPNNYDIGEYGVSVCAPVKRFAKLFYTRCNEIFGKGDYGNVSVSVYIGQIALLKANTPAMIKKYMKDLGKADLFHSGLVFALSCDSPKSPTAPLPSTSIITTLELWDMSQPLFSSLIPMVSGTTVLTNVQGDAQVLFVEPPTQNCLNPDKSDFWSDKWDNLQYVGDIKLKSLVKGQNSLYMRARLYHHRNPKYRMFNITNKVCEDDSCNSDVKVLATDNSCDTFSMGMVNELTYMDPSAFPKSLWKHLYFNSFQIAVGNNLSNMEIITDEKLKRDKTLVKDINQYSKNIQSFFPAPANIFLQIPVIRNPQRTAAYGLLHTLMNNPLIWQKIDKGTSYRKSWIPPYKHVLFGYIVQNNEWKLVKLTTQELKSIYGTSPGQLYSRTTPSLCDKDGNCQVTTC